MPKTVSFGAQQPQPEQPPIFDPGRVSRQRAMAEAILAGTNRPITGWGEGISQLANTAAAGFIGRRADENETAQNQARAEAMRNILASDDPLTALSQSNDPELVSMGMNAQLAQLLKDPGETYNTLSDEEERQLGLDPAGTYQRSSTGKVDVLSQPKAPEAPVVKDFFEGGQVIQKQWNATTNTWEEVGRGGRWQPQQAPAEPDRVRRAKAAGLVEGTPEFNEFVLGSDIPDTTKPENILRDEFNTITKDFRTSQDAYQKIVKSAQSGTGPGDMSVMYGIIKMLDPNSAVREGEYATAAQAQSIPNRILAQYNKAVAGELMSPEMRAQFVAEAGNLYQVQKQAYDRIKSSYSSIAERSGANPKNVIVEYADPSIVIPETPPVDLGTGTPSNSIGGPDERGGDLPTVATPEDAAKLPKGTRFRDPNGVIRIVP